MSTCIQAGRRYGVMHKGCGCTLQNGDILCFFSLEREIRCDRDPGAVPLLGRAWLWGLSPGSCSGVALGGLVTPGGLWQTIVCGPKAPKPGREGNYSIRAKEG